jgi:hypothetical protein
MKKNETGNNDSNENTDLVEKYISWIKSRPFIALVVVIGIVIIAAAEFTDSTKNLISFWRSLKNEMVELPDLKIMKIDAENNKVHIWNAGNKSVSTEKMELCWSEGWYKKPEWNNCVKISSAQYIGVRTLKPGNQISVVIPMLHNADEKTELMIDPTNLIREKNEQNNCSDIQGNEIPCRSWTN